MNDNNHVIFLDYVRVLACFLVMIVHSTEPFYLCDGGSLISSYSNGLWADFFDTLARCCVPLFVITSSYLLFPLNTSPKEFFRHRAVRVLIPFVIWAVFYAFYWGEPVENLRDLVFNFNYSAGHLWFVYMLIGLYLIMPLLSPWAQNVQKRELNIWIGLWLFTTLIPFFRDWLSADPLVITYGPTGIPHQALFPLWGEASWNHYGTFYYISGFIGYMFIGMWLRKFGDSISLTKSFAYGIPSFLGGFAICFYGFLRRFTESAQGQYPVGGSIDLGVWWETAWCNDTFGVALMTIGVILMMKNIRAQGWCYLHLLLPISKAGYGMYLGHMVALVFYAGLYSSVLSSTPLIILATAVSSFITAAIVAVAVQKIPYIGKYIIG